MSRDDAVAIEQEPDDAIDFERAQVEGREGRSTAGDSWLECPRCNAEIERYFTIGGHVACGACAERVRDDVSKAYSARTFGRALAYGALAATLGAIVWHLIREVTHLEIGLVAIAVGVAIGLAVKRATGGHGGKRYQALAMFLTYSSIALTNVPPILDALRAQVAKDHAAQAQTAAGGAQPATSTQPAVVADARPAGAPVQPAPPPPSERPAPTLGGFLIAWALIIGLAYASPFLAGAQNVMGIIIIGIGLYEAWKFTRGAPPRIEGPYAASRRADDA